MSSTGGDDTLHSYDGDEEDLRNQSSGKKAVHEKKSRHRCDGEEQSAMFSSRVVFPPDYVKVRQAIEGMEQ